MIDQVINGIVALKWPILVYIALTLVAVGIYWFYTTNFVFKKSKVTAFALLYNLNLKQVVAFALLVCRLCFVLTSAIFCKDINLGYLIVLLLFVVLIYVFTKDNKMLISNILNTIAVFILLFVEGALYNYYLTVERIGVVMAMVVLIGVFAVLYTALLVLSNYETIIRRQNEN